MTTAFRSIVLATAALLWASTAVRADPTLGITVTPLPGGAGGLRIAAVTPGGLGELLGLRKGEILLTIGNPQEKVPDMLLHSRKELVDALKSIGDHVRLLVFDLQKFFFVEGDIDDANPVSWEDEDDTATTTLVALKKGKARTKVKGPREKVHKVKPKSVTQLLKTVKKAVKKQPRVVRGTVKRTPTHAPTWHPLAKDKGKGKGKKPGRKKVLFNQREDMVV